MWRAVLTKYQDLNNQHTFETMESGIFLQHLDADIDNAVVIQKVDGQLAIWNAGSDKYASAEFPLEDPNDTEITDRDLGEVVNLWF